MKTYKTSQPKVIHPNFPSLVYNSHPSTIVIKTKNVVYSQKETCGWLVEIDLTSLFLFNFNYQILSIMI